MDFSSKLANNDKLTSDKHKKHLENNLYLYCSAKDYKLDFYLKNRSVSATTDLLAAASKKPLEK